MHVKLVAQTTGITDRNVKNTIELLEGGATVPFISRYRKEATGNLDEVQITAVKEQLQKLKDVDKRRETIVKAIDEQGKLTEELKDRLQNTYALSELEDIYLPYKQKRKTRATTAREKGLEGLAKILMKQQDSNPEARAIAFVKGVVSDVEEALQGARDIIAEWVNESTAARNTTRRLFARAAVIKAKVVKGKEEEGEKYKDYFKYEERLSRCPSHRMLAIKRGEQEGILRVGIAPPEEEALQQLERIFVKGNSAASAQVKQAVKEGYKRLLMPSIETEFSNGAKTKADEEAILVFARNLRQLLLASPLGQKRILAIDPGFRTGCKVVCLDEQGNLLHNETIYPHAPQKETGKAAAKISGLVGAYKVDAIAIGNGTAGRETEYFVKKIRFNHDVQVFVVNEAGASIYSASKIAREEFPNYDVTVRGAVSIGRRLADPLAELVKIDPKSIGVGQYQHDVDQNQLQASLTNVVESCVNAVGVDLNTASKHLLTYISGLGPQLAQNIVDYRKEHGAFTSRKQLKKVPRMGEKAFEQCSGFLRIRNGIQPLDNSAVHPESYHIVEQMAKDMRCTVTDLLNDEAMRKGIAPEKYVGESVGALTVKDILEELAKPGRDPRQKIKVFEFAKGIHTIDDLQEGMVLPGIVSNITNFGAFVDVGVKQDGLVHISNLANEFISNPADYVQLHQHVKVKVLEVDAARKRIQLSMKDVD